jgi:hypothetical protein
MHSSHCTCKYFLTLKILQYGGNYLNLFKSHLFYVIYHEMNFISLEF